MPNLGPIRLIQPADEPQVQLLDARVQPYRAEDQADVEAMYERARIAQQQNDRWTPIPGPKPVTDPPKPAYHAFWGFFSAGPAEPERLVGMIGAGPVNYNLLPASMPFVQGLQARGNNLELKHLRVDPDFRRLGIGRRLCQTVIDWAADQGYPLLLLNTSTPQKPARSLYQKLGFYEVAITFIGQYELVWMERKLPHPNDLAQ